MNIKFVNFSDGIHQFDFDEKIESLQWGESPFIGSLLAKVKMDKSAYQIVLECSVSCEAVLTCDRCAVDFRKRLDNKFVLTYIFTRDKINEDSELDVYYLAPEVTSINLASDIYDYLELALPLKTLCKDDCRGICIRCGTNLNESKCNCNQEDENPVWGPLKSLKNNLE